MKFKEDSENSTGKINLRHTIFSSKGVITKMKLSAKLGIILFAFIVFYPYISFAEIQIKYDRFKDKTTVQTDPKKTRGTKFQPALVLIGSYGGQSPSKPGVCDLALALQASSWEYLRCHSVACLADGKPVELPPPKHDGHVRRGYVLEFIIMMVPFNTIEQLSKSEKVELKICNTEFTLTKEEMQDLRTFVEAFAERK
jgi:hypothetical protein